MQHLQDIGDVHVEGAEPVPAVVGTATMGAIPSGSARVHQSPTSSRSNTEIVWPCISATILRAWKALTRPSASPAVTLEMPELAISSTMVVSSLSVGALFTFQGWQVMNMLAVPFIALNRVEIWTLP